MNLPISWLQDFVDLSGVSVPDLVARLSESTGEVSSVRTLYMSLQEIIAVRIISKKAHPKRDDLYLCQVDTGKVCHEVVCGAPNTAEGLIVPFADIGTKLANGLVLQRKEICGEYSHGMLLSEHELDISEDHSGLMVLPPETILGTPLSKVLNIAPETILEIDNNSITNRPDLWGIYGMARECAAIFELPFKAIDTPEWKQHILSLFSDEPAPVTVDVRTDKCLTYDGFCVDGVNATQLSPWKIAHRLRAMGVRPINLLVDLSNYVMLEIGIPNHFFDRDKIHAGQLNIDLCSDSQSFTTLDDVQRVLEPGDILVSDLESPLVIAGLMGGKDSGIAPSTTKIFVEGAVWDAETIRKMSTRLGLRTDASVRYEKSVDPYSIGLMLYRCVELLKEFYPDCQLIGHIQHGGKAVMWTRYEVDLDIERTNILLSMDVSTEQAKNVLERLGFFVKETESHHKVLSVYPPSWRSSKEHMAQADLIEEIGRILGYTHVRSNAPLWALLPKTLPPHVKMKRNIQDFLVLAGQALEVITHPLIGEKLLKNAAWEDKNEDLILAHALSPDRNRLRPSLLPSFLEVLELNQKYFESFRFFEYGKVAHALDKEDTHIGYASASRQSSSFLEVADTVEALLKNLNIDAKIISGQMDNPLLPAQWPGTHPYEVLHIHAKKEIVGYVVSLHPLFLRQKKIRGFVTIFEIKITDWLKELSAEPYQYEPPLRYQESVLDFTVLASKGEEVGRILSCVPSWDPVHHIVGTKILTVFHMDKAVKAVTLRIRLNSAERTLTHEDLKVSEQFIIATLADNGWDLKN